MIKKFLRWLFLHKCDLCKERTDDLQWFYKIGNTTHEKICNDCVSLERLRNEPYFHSLVEDELRERGML